jgi:hypothetical protein
VNRLEQILVARRRQASGPRDQAPPAQQAYVGWLRLYRHIIRWPESAARTHEDMVEVPAVRPDLRRVEESPPRVLAGDGQVVRAWRIVGRSGGG